MQYAALASQISTLQQAEAPRRTIKAITPAMRRRAKRKAESLVQAAEMRVATSVLGAAAVQ